MNYQNIKQILGKIITVCFSVLVLQTPLLGQQPKQWNATQIYHEMTKLPVLGKVLYLAAHPDDENTRFISYCANEWNYETAYLSLTRGDGGQNLIGAEVGDELGLIRTQELLEARRIDGAKQFFTRALDFGYSKSAEESYQFWGKEAVLADVVWVIRTFKPDIIVCRFPTDGGGGHGHHTASAQLALEAFGIAANPEKFKNQLKHTEVWQPKRIVVNTGRWWNSNISANDPGVVALDVGTYNANLGKSYSEIAALSRSQHKSQGFGTTGIRGELLEYFEFLGGDTAKKDLMDGVNSSWNRVQGSGRVEKAIQKLLHDFESCAPEKSIPQLIQILDHLDKLSEIKSTQYTENQRWIQSKKRALEQIIIQCLGLYGGVHSDAYYKTKGDSLQINFEWINRSDISVTLESLACEKLNFHQKTAKLLAKHQKQVWSEKFLVNLQQPTQPLWLQKPPVGARYQIEDLEDRTRAENLPELSFVATFNIMGRSMAWTFPVTYHWNDPVKGEMHRPFIIAPKFTGLLNQDLGVFTKAESQYLELIIYKHSDENEVRLEANTPPGWEVEIPKRILFKNGVTVQKVPIKITPSNMAKMGKLMFEANGQPLTHWRTISYDHIKTLDWFKPTSLNLIYEKMVTTPRKIGYIEGAGDHVPSVLRLLGYEVQVLTNEDLLNVDLSAFQTIITGIRFLNVNEKADLWMQQLLNYASEGGNLILQYNTRHALKTENFSPYPISLSRDRVTEEDAKVTFLDPKHPIMTTPNALTEKDFALWVQERGLYFPDTWSDEYAALFAWNDVNETPKKGALLTTKYGKGTYTYTGISFFRQLPTGVPGAFKLMVNLIEQP